MKKYLWLVWIGLIAFNFAASLSAEEIDEKTPLEVLQKSAEAGNADAQYYLGEKYYHGKGVPKDFSITVKWYQKAAEQGYVKAQYNLGNMYYDGEGVSKDFVMAINWYQEAANQGDAHSQYTLGLMYEAGKGVIKDSVTAAKWYQKAAEQGFAEAQYNLAHMSSSNKDVTVTENSFATVEGLGKAEKQDVVGALSAEEIETEPSEMGFYMAVALSIFAIVFLIVLIVLDPIFERERLEKAKIRQEGVEKWQKKR